jgi:hypothetical protein
MMMKTTPVALALAALLTACGGGGGGGSGSVVPAGVLTTANYQSVSTTAAAATVDAGAASSVSTLASVSPATDGSASALSSVRLIQRVIGGIRFGPQLETAQAVSSSTAYCAAGGSATLTLADTNNNGRLDIGETLSFSFANCIIAAGDPVLSGTLSVTATSLTVSGSSLVAGQFNIAFAGLTSGTASLNGNASYGFDASSETTTFQNLATTRKGQTVVYGFTAVQNTAASPNTLSISGSLVAGNASYTLSTPTPLTVGAAYPSGGLLRVSDASGSRADVTPSGAQFSVLLYASGGSTPSATYAATWASIL